MNIFFSPLYLFVFVFAYLLGSIPFGLILTRAAGKGDIRTIGSGNIGTTNVLRTGNKKLAALTLLGDLLKGTFAVLGASYILSHASLSPWEVNHIYIPLASFMAFLGHIYPVWLRFQGGKGVATFLGVLLGFVWPMALLFVILWLMTAYLTKYSSLAALIASVVVAFATISYYGLSIGFFVSLMVAFIVYKHRTNIERLKKGVEPKIGQSKS